MSADQQMKAAVLHAPGDIRCEYVGIPRIAGNEVLVKVKAAGICGSDARRVMVTGTYSFPTIPGHEFAGEVVEVGSEASARIGDRVVVFPLIPCRTCEQCQVGSYNLCENYNYLGSRTDGGFAQFVKVPSWNLMPIPPEVDFESAALTEPMSVALHAVRRGGLTAGDTVAVFGTGPIGLMVAQWARALGAKDVFLVDTVEEKLQLAVGLGFSTKNCINASTDDPVEAIMDRTSGKGVAFSIEAAGVVATMKGALQVVRKHGRVVLLGNPENDVTFTSQLVSRILRSEISVHGTWNSQFGTLPVDEWEFTMRAMAKGMITVAPLISHRFSLDEAPAVFDMMYNRREIFHRMIFLPNPE